MVIVQIGNITIPDILLDTGFAFDGLMIYNTDYNDSLKFLNPIKVKVPGAGGGVDRRHESDESLGFQRE